jgi:hypothetical protein
MKAKQESIRAAVEELEHTLDTTGDRGRLDRALAGIEQAVREHAEALDGERLIDVENPRLPSPGVDRKVGALRQELGELLAQTRVLRDRLGQASGDTPDFGPLRARFRRLLRSFGQYEADEVCVILDTLNTDIGAGD